MVTPIGVVLRDAHHKVHIGQGVVGGVVVAADGVGKDDVGVHVTPSSSSAAFTVTVWAVSHVVVEKVSTLLVSVSPDRVRSVPECPLTVTVTSPAAAGW